MLFHTDFALVMTFVSKYTHTNILEGVVEEILYLNSLLPYYIWKCKLQLC